MNIIIFGFICTTERAHFTYNMIKQESKTLGFNEFEIFKNNI